MDLDAARGVAFRVRAVPVAALWDSRAQRLLMPAVALRVKRVPARAPPALRASLAREEADGVDAADALHSPPSNFAPVKKPLAKQPLRAS